MSRVIPLYQTDSTIIEGIRNNNDEAIAALYKKHKAICLKSMSFLYADEETNKDIYQDAVIVFIEKIRSNSLELVNTSIQTYLNAICRNQIRVRYKKDKKLQLAGDDIDNDEQEYYTDWFNETNGINQERVWIINEELQQMKEAGSPCFEVLKQFFFEKKTMEQIAASMKYNNTDTAKNRKYNCQERLKRQVLERLQHA